ncbi:hypothetical protein LCGC14_1774650 [marine sediment metagenome]|uniref:Uncharacterized protein n=1 Tax=marine sediment metagenome TaxID=412755 RepID=A0A0F9JWX8_9ZZZZ
MKTDNKYNPYAFDVWVTTRKYVSAFAVMHAIIALKRKGWTIDVGSPTTNHFIVAYKPVSEINEC